jgi:3-dehydroquinate synthetase/predicted NBD/HSP70 family sugar kinase
MSPIEPVAVFDVGGTSVRSAVLDADDRLRSPRAQPAPSRFALAGERAGERTETFCELLVDLLGREARRLALRHQVRSAGVSLGAAIDHRTGLVLGSGPLWGPGANLQFDMAAALAQAVPELRWLVVNDLTANAVALAARPENRHLKRLAAVVVGTGLGMRTIEVRTGRVATGADSGLQGEIGHLPATFSLDGREILLSCDCGAPGHLSAYASGRGLNRLLRLLADEGEPCLAADAPLMDQFKGGLARGEPRARQLLDAITRPLALALLQVMTIDAEVDRIFLSGGVPFAFGERYLASLIAQMDAIGLYGRVGSLTDRVSIVERDSEIGLRGAGQLVRARCGSLAVDRRWVVPGDEPKSYEVLLTRDLLDPCRPMLRAAVGLERDGGQRRLLVCDSRVWKLYGEQLEASLLGGPGRVELETLLLDVDEPTKALPAVQSVIDAFDRFGLLRRSEPVLTFGGGALLDVVGFAASIYRRGVPYVKVPTTLLAMIDAAIGVKTGINYNGCKSRLGSYYPPSQVLIDPAFLLTLDLRQYRSGLAESVKVALVADPVLFDALEASSAELGVGAADESTEVEVIERSVTAMLDELTGNLREECLERLVDIGHSFSPAMECQLEPYLLHGECVAIDLALTVALSEARGLLHPATAERILQVLTSLGLPITHPDVTLELLSYGLTDTLRHRDGLQRVPLLRGIGQALFVSDIGLADLDSALCSLEALEATQTS